MNQPLQKQLLQQFQSYDWGTLYESIKNVKQDTTKPIETQFQLAFKAMLLISWWNDNFYSKQLLSLFPRIIKDPLVHFAVTYGYICLGEAKTFKRYLKFTPKNYPVWMKNYLEIEILARSFKFKTQVIQVKKLIPKNQYPKDYIKIALLQSLEHERADISYLKEYLQEINLIEDNDPLSVALCIRVGLLDINSADTTLSPLLLSKKARYQLLNSNEVIESLKTYDQLVQTKLLDINSLNYWLTTSVSIPQGKDSLIARANYALNLAPDSLYVSGSVASYALIHLYINEEYLAAYNLVQKYLDYLKLTPTKAIKNVQIFFRYIIILFNWQQENQELYVKISNQKELQVFGESHSLSLSNINTTLNNQEYHCSTSFIIGIKMYHLANSDSNYISSFMLEHLKKIQPNADMLFTIGEIDTRPSEGIWQVHLNKDKDLDEIIETTVIGYINFLEEHLKDKQANSITIQGIPAPNYEFKDEFDPIDHKGFLEMIIKVNTKLQNETLQKGWNFLDVYSATLGDDGKSNKKYHIDTIHLKPSFYIEADKWLIKPEPKELPKTTTIDFSKYKTVSLSKPN